MNKRAEYLDSIADRTSEWLANIDEENFSGVPNDILSAITEDTLIANEFDIEKSLKALKKASQENDSFVDSPLNLLEKKKKPQKIRRIVLLVAAIITATCFATAVAAQGMGFDVFGRIASWTSDVFSFNDTRGASNVFSQSEKAQITYFDTTEEAVSQLGLEGYLPTKVPDRFNLMNVYAVSFTGLSLTAEYTTENGEILSINLYKGRIGSPNLEKDARIPEIVEIDGITYYLFSNNKLNVVTWEYQDVQVNIFTHASKEEIIEMLYSIG